MRPLGMTAIALLMAPLSSLRCLLFLRFQFSTAYCSTLVGSPTSTKLQRPSPLPDGRGSTQATDRSEPRASASGFLQLALGPV